MNTATTPTPSTASATQHNKVAVVTGGTQGLGAAIAQLLAQRGAAGVVICGRQVDKGLAQAQQITQASGVRVVFVQADLGQVDDCRQVIATADAEFGRVDVLVNAAAITDPHQSDLRQSVGARIHGAGVDRPANGSGTSGVVRMAGCAG